MAYEKNCGSCGVEEVKEAVCIETSKIYDSCKEEKGALPQLWAQITSNRSDCGVWRYQMAWVSSRSHWLWAEGESCCQ